MGKFDGPQHPEKCPRYWGDPGACRCGLDAMESALDGIDDPEATLEAVRRLIEAVEALRDEARRAIEDPHSTGMLFGSWVGQKCDFALADPALAALREG